MIIRVIMNLNLQKLVISMIVMQILLLGKPTTENSQCRYLTAWGNLICKSTTDFKKTESWCWWDYRSKCWAKVAASTACTCASSSVKLKERVPKASLKANKNRMDWWPPYWQVRSLLKTSSYIRRWPANMLPTMNVYSNQFTMLSRVMNHSETSSWNHSNNFHC